jgi:hypothetical protein
MPSTKTLYLHLISSIARTSPRLRVSQRHHLAYEIRDSLLLAGYLLDLSGLQAGAFYLNAFVQPLYVPHESIFLTFGKRLSGGKRWIINAEDEAAVMEEVLRAIEEEGKSLVDELGAIERLAGIAEGKPGSKENPFGWRLDDPNILETRAYTWALLRDQSRARRDLLYLTQVFMPTYPWEKEIQNRSSKILDALDKSVEAAGNVLADWAKQTASQLGLDIAPII